jgi:hypothetical protein
MLHLQGWGGDIDVDEMPEDPVAQPSAQKHAPPPVAASAHGKQARSARNSVREDDDGEEIGGEPRINKRSSLWWDDQNLVKVFEAEEPSSSEDEDEDELSEAPKPSTIVSVCVREREYVCV